MKRIIEYGKEISMLQLQTDLLIESVARSGNKLKGQGIEKKLKTVAVSTAP